jgi:hypothetical protein
MAVVRRVLLTLVPIRPRSRCELHSLRTISPGDRSSPLTPHFQSRHASMPFNSASDAYELHPHVRSYGQLPSEARAEAGDARRATTRFERRSRAGTRRSWSGGSRRGGRTRYASTRERSGSRS